LQLQRPQAFRNNLTVRNMIQTIANITNVPMYMMIGILISLGVCAVEDHDGSNERSG
jgi:hypothetical protein